MWLIACSCNTLAYITLKGEVASLLVWGRGEKQQFEGFAAALALTSVFHLFVAFFASVFPGLSFSLI